MRPKSAITLLPRREMQSGFENFGFSEVIQQVTIKKSSRKHTIFNVYGEHDRKSFEVNRMKFWSATFAVFESPLKENDGDSNKLTLVMGDFDIRLGVRGGEKSSSGTKADNFTHEIDKAQILVIHGRACK